MTYETELIERLDRIEEQVVPLTETARALTELRDELAPRVNEAVHALILELADVEADFQLEDLVYLLKNGMRNIRNLNFTLDQLKNLIDFVIVAEPLLKTTVPQFIDYFDELERKGVFRLLTIGLDILKKIGSTYSTEQLQQIGDGLVQLVGILQKVTTPATLDLLDKAADVPATIDLDNARPVGMGTLLGALSDVKVKAGVGVAMELTRGLAALKA